MGKKFCEHCGTAMELDDLFCPSCGQKIIYTEEEILTESDMSNEFETSKESQIQQMPETSEKSQIQKIPET
ncbi:MAG: zinc ribbon domain-containing protein, partial [Alkaliphilus sp.]|nr:zinc ribbon domain-containing protein [Alkaliphilus sp.]